MLVFAHLSDTHFDGGPRALERTRRVLAHLRGLPLDAILVTGDIADHGAVHEYEQARAELTADVPVMMLPGNHDDRAAYRKVLLGQDGTAPVNEVVRIGGATFALCDSSIPGENGGLLDTRTLAWLDEVLSRADGPAFVCLHHHPVPVHHPLLDGIALAEPERLAEVIRRHPRVVAILCGHVHSAAVSTLAGRPVIIAPGVVSTTRLPWTVTAELTWQNTVDLADAPAVAFHVLDDDGGLVTHFRAVPAA